MAAAKGKAKTAKKKKESRLSDEARRVIRLVVAFIFLVICGVTLASLVSYIFTWQADQSIYHNPEAWNIGFGVQNICGKLGFVWADLLIAKLFGIGAFFVPIFLGALAFYCMKIRKVRLVRIFLLSLYGCIIFSLLSANVTAFFPELLQGVFSSNAGGSYGYFANLWLTEMIGPFGAAAIILLLFFIWITLLTRKVALWFDNLIYKAFNPSAKPSTDASEGTSEPVAPADVDEGAEEDDDLIVNDGGSITLIDESDWNKNREDDGGYKEEESGHVGARNVKRDELTLDIVQGDDLTSTLNADVEHEYDPRLDLSNYQFPSHALLEDYRDKWYEVSRDELEQNKNKIVKTLANYKVSVARIEARRGPTVTLYRIHLSDGIRIATVKRLEEDIAMSLGAKGVRVLVLADAIGIEVANQKPSVVPLKMVLNSPQFVEASATMELPVAIGITVTNEPFYFDLAKMPHLLIAGATGTGKSVGLNTLITSLLYTKHPAEMKFVMVDPKKVELDFYEKLEKHYLAMLPDAEESIITDTKKVIHTLRSLCIEMDARYDLLRGAGVRKITEYNAKFLRRKLSPAKGHKYLPYIVVIIDEFADLITTAGREIEEPIARLAQKARAVGIHLVIATQRPTTDVITGTIKANFNARIAFKVNASVDSKTILDQTGANRLIGRGDMLVVYPGLTDITRVQCALIETEEVEKVTRHIGEQQGYSTPFHLPEYSDDEEVDVASSVDLKRRDKLFEDAARIIVQTQQGSTSLLQRKMEIGYNKAGRIMDQLEVAGIVGPARGSKPRDVLVQDFDTLDRIFTSLDNA